jgi:hypothetical protein
MRNATRDTFIAAVAGLIVLSFFCPASAAEDAWKAETIADALQAAPPAVTNDATILGWSFEGDLIVARYGAGPYTCIASGSFSLRLGKAALPYPDPMCMDENAWAFLQALWSDAKPYPTAPGLVWMLAGMNVSKAAVDVGASMISTTQGAEEPAEAQVVQMTPHVMILPLPFDEANATLTTNYQLDDPLAPWIMAAGKPHEHLMVHFSAEDTAVLMDPAN